MDWFNVFQMYIRTCNKSIFLSILLLLFSMNVMACGNLQHVERSEQELIASEEGRLIEDAHNKNSVPHKGASQSGDKVINSESFSSKKYIRVTDNNHTVVEFILNDSEAAKGLYNQLPLQLEVKDYSDNEKIFYPSHALPVTNTPHAAVQVGTLAYFEPWGNVVMFFGTYRPHPGLYELGHIISSVEDISQLNGTITINKIEE